MKHTILLVFFAFATTLYAQTIIRVTTNGTGDGTSWSNASSLQNAMTIANAGDQVWVQAGVYDVFTTLVVPQGVLMYGGFWGDETELTQRSFARNRTVFDGGRSGQTVVRLRENAVLSGFAVINGHSNIDDGTLQPDGGGVWMEANAQVINSYILDNTASRYGGGIFADGDGLVFNTLIVGNTAGVDGLAIWGTTLTVRNVTATQNRHEDDLPIVDANRCNIRTPAWVILGTQSFATDSVWFTDTLLWSDAVSFSTCNKTSFDGGTVGPPSVFNVDCRSNPDFPGDLFSWCAVMRFSDLLCPAPWRVPTTEELGIFDMTFGGTGEARSDMNFIHPDYISPASVRCVRDSIPLPPLPPPPPPPPLPPPPGCNDNTPNWGESLGTVSFYTDNVWIIGNQIWSDAVTATVCQKEEFEGIEWWDPFTETGSFHADCRSNPGFPGDLFSWCAVIRFQNQLCPYPWRVPTSEEFIVLDLTMGGTGNTRWSPDLPEFIQENYIIRWGGAFGGRSIENGYLESQGTSGLYWSRTIEYDYFTFRHSRYFGMGQWSGSGGLWFHVTNYEYLNPGLTVRCIRDTLIVPPPPPLGCNANTPGFGPSLGMVTFHTDDIWVIGNQVWSDAVTASNCQKTTFDGGDFLSHQFNADCRSNPGFPGDLFSWCAVARFADELCPYPWRVPTIQEFRDLDVEMGGTGGFRGDTWNNQDPVFVQDNYITRWGGAFGGIAVHGGILHNQNFHGDYWSQTAVSTDLMFIMQFRTDGSIYPGFQSVKDGGMALRCVRDTTTL